MMRIFPHRPRIVGWACALALLVIACGSGDSGILPPPSPPPPPPPPSPPSPPGVIATLTVDSLTKFQVMTGWEATSGVDQTNPNFLLWRDQVLDLAAGDLGINRFRIPVRNGVENPVDYYAQLQAGQITDAEWRCKRYTTVNDNSDPNSIAATGFHFTELDERIERVVLPMKQRVEARGETLVLNLNYTAFLSQCNPLPPYPHASPAEYAEFMVAVFQHLQQKYGLVPNLVEVILEPDNTGASSPWTGTLVGQAIAAAGPRLAAAGFHPKFVAPSTKDMGTAIVFFDALIRVSGVLPYLSEIAYHRYGGVSDANLAALADRARTNGLKTAMLEHIGSDVEDLYKDIVLGRASAWQQFVLAFPTTDDGAQYYLITNNQPVIASRTRYFRQYFRYVRLGAQRVAVSSDNANMRPVGFMSADGKFVVVIHSGQAGNVFVRGLRPGTYGASMTTASASGTELGDQVVGTAGTIVVAAPASGVLTIYRK